MSEPHDANRTVDVPSAPADSLDAGLAAGPSRGKRRAAGGGARRSAERGK
jgi:hypothetical protein